MNEKEAKRIVGEWLQSCGCDIYDEVKNEWNWPVFTFKGSERPDLLVHKSSKGGKDIWIAIEVENGDECDAIITGFYQVLRQFYAYISGQSTFSIGSEQIALQAFALATNNSPDGFLYKEEEPFDILIHNVSKYRRTLKRLEEFPEVMSDIKKKVIEPLRYPWPEAPWPYVLSRAMWKLAEHFREHVRSMPMLPGFSPRSDADEVVIGTLQEHFTQNRPYVLAGPRRGGHLYL
jgi:hypothetical protein